MVNDPTDRDELAAVSRADRKREKQGQSRSDCHFAQVVGGAVEGELKLHLRQTAAMEAGQALVFAQVSPQWLDDCATPAQLAQCRRLLEHGRHRFFDLL